MPYRPASRLGDGNKGQPGQTPEAWRRRLPVACPAKITLRMAGGYCESPNSTRAEPLIVG
jgi:hypothetical protein